MPDAAVSDLIKYAIQEKPLDFEVALTNILAGRTTAAVDTWKQNIATQLLDGPEEETEDEPEVEAGLDNEPETIEEPDNNGEAA